jgi:hypothetical protein
VRRVVWSDENAAFSWLNLLSSRALSINNLEDKTDSTCWCIDHSSSIDIERRLLLNFPPSCRSRRAAEAPWRCRRRSRDIFKFHSRRPLIEPAHPARGESSWVVILTQTRPSLGPFRPIFVLYGRTNLSGWATSNFREALRSTICDLGPPVLTRIEFLFFGDAINLSDQATSIFRKGLEFVRPSWRYAGSPRDRTAGRYKGW